MAHDSGGTSGLVGTVHEMVHRDIELANTYRLEGIKHSVTLALAALVFTVTFRKDFLAPSAGASAPLGLIGIGWALLVVSVLCGLAEMHLWERFYVSYRDDARERATGTVADPAIKARRKRLILAQSVLAIARAATLVLGLVALAIYGVWAT